MLQNKKRGEEGEGKKRKRKKKRTRRISPLPPSYQFPLKKPFLTHTKQQKVSEGSAFMSPTQNLGLGGPW
jgi:hypothetical protein